MTYMPLKWSYLHKEMQKGMRKAGVALYLRKETKWKAVSRLRGLKGNLELWGMW